MDNLDSLVRPLESFAATKPGLYRLRVGLLAALGYVYLLSIVLILLAIVGVGPVLRDTAVNTRRALGAREAVESGRG